MKTREEVEALKTNWREDPCYDLDQVEGFEEYKDELVEYQNQCSLEWDRARERLLFSAMAKYLPTMAHNKGADDWLVLCNHLARMDQELDSLKDQVFELKEEITAMRRGTK